MLAGLGAAVIPLVLHLLSRSRYRSHDWAAMMFLPCGDVRQERSARLKQWFLLALRTAMIALLTLAVARPRGLPLLASVGGAGEASVVIVMDRSASMGFDEGGRTRMAMAADAAREILRNLRPGDRALLLGAGQGQAEPEGSFSGDLRALEERAGELRPGWGSANMRDSLSAAMDLLDESRDARRRIYVVCDRQANNWSQVDEAFAEAWRRRAVASGGNAPVELVVVPVGTEDRENVAVRGIQILNEPAIRGELADVQVTVRNFGAEPRSGLALQIMASGRESTSTITLAPGETQTIFTSVRLADPGSIVLSATIRSGSLAWDNTARAEVEVVDPLAVLIVSGDERERSAQSESTYPRAALAPFAARGRPGGADLAKVDVRTVADWNDGDLARYRAVILANIPRVTAGQARSLERYVWGGGGLLVTAGTLIEDANYNALLFRGGEGPLPGAITGVRELVEPAWIASARIGHPVFRFLRGVGVEALEAGRVTSCLDVTPSSAARVLASFSDGSPALIERPMGRGRVMMFCTTADLDWTSLPLTNAYLPLIQSVVRYISGGTVINRNLNLGDEIVASFDEGGGAILVRPDRSDIRLAATRLGERHEVHYGPVREPGLYRVNPVGGREKGVNFVVRPPAESQESDLTPLRSGQWEQLARSMGLTVVWGKRDEIARVVRAGREEIESWPLFIGLVIAVGLVEMAVARRWSAAEGG